MNNYNDNITFLNPFVFVKKFYFINFLFIKLCYYSKKKILHHKYESLRFLTAVLTDWGLINQLGLFFLLDSTQK